MARVRAHRRRGRFVRAHSRRNPRKSIVKVAVETGRTINEIYDLISDNYNFVSGSEEQRKEIALETALSMGIPYVEAIRIATRLALK